MMQLIYAERPELKNKIYIAYCPERVLPGNVLYELEHNDRVIGGINEESTEKAVQFYSRFVKGNLQKRSGHHVRSSLSIYTSQPSRSLLQMNYP